MEAQDRRRADGVTDSFGDAAWRPTPRIPEYVFSRFCTFLIDSYTIVCSYKHSPLATDPSREVALSLYSSPGACAGTVSFARESSPRYGEEIREEILAVFADLRSLAAEVRLAAGPDLAWLRVNDRFAASGLPRFADLCSEILGIGASTAYDRIRVAAIAGEHEAVRKEYLAGRLTDRHVLDLGAVLKGAGEAQVKTWVGRALVCTTRELRAVIEAEKPGVELDEERESYSFKTDAGLNSLYDEGKNTGEKMAGQKLSHEGFLRTALDEASSSIPEPPEEQPFEWKFAAKPLGPGEKGAEDKTRERDEKGEGDEKNDAETSADAPKPKPIPPRIVTRADIAEARRTLLVVREMMATFRISVSRKPTSTSQAVALLLELLKKERALHIVSGRLVRTFRRCGAAWFSSSEEFHAAVGLAMGVDKRTAQNLAGDAFLFESRPSLRRAYERGTITIEQAHTIDALGFQTEEAYLEDASTLSRAAFFDLARTILRVKDIDGLLFLRVRGRMDYRVVMAGLIRTAGKKFGVTHAQILAAFRANKLDATTPAPLRATGCDVRFAPILLRRLQVVLDLMGARIWRDELPESVRTKLSGRPRRRTVTIRSSTKRDLLDVERKISGWEARMGNPCSRERAMTLLLRIVLEEWTKRDPKLRPDPAIVRDDYRCMVPGCGARGHLHDHHVEFVSHGGSNELWNRVTLCWWHHRELHEGRMTVTGRADGILYWKVGTAQPRDYKGNVRLRVAGEAETGASDESNDPWERLEA